MHSFVVLNRSNDFQVFGAAHLCTEVVGNMVPVQDWEVAGPWGIRVSFPISSMHWYMGLSFRRTQSLGFKGLQLNQQFSQLLDKRSVSLFSRLLFLVYLY